MRRGRLLPYLFIAPSAIVLAVFWLYPLANAFYMSLVNDSGQWVGLDNYRALMGPYGGFWHSLGVSLWYLAGTVPAALVISFLLANLLFQRLRARGFYRLIYFLPYITSTVAAATVWRWIFNPRSTGIANAILEWLGFDPQRWYYESTGVFVLMAEGAGFDLPDALAGPSLALVCAIVFGIWHTLGFNIVIFLAGLSVIPNELHEAAEMDGAGLRQRLLHVTVPLLMPTIFFLTIVSIIRSFQTFNEIYVMTREESIASTQNLTMLIFNKFYLVNDYGAATAAAVILFLILLALTIFQLVVVGRKVHY
ncbi:MAG: carbohydrate ABC transporter permease [Candidatus Sumerlaeota bacterium]